MLVDESRLIAPDYDVKACFRGLKVNAAHFLRISEVPAVMVDPTYLADAYNSEEDEAQYVRGNGLFILNFGGDVSGPLWFEDPYVVMPISGHVRSQDRVKPSSAHVLVERIGCDSGSFVLLPVTRATPDSIRAKIEKRVKRGNAVLLNLPSGRWELLFEQFDPPQPNMRGLRRNIVLKRTK